jgi:hypothetical protein
VTTAIVIGLVLVFAAQMLTLHRSGRDYRYLLEVMVPWMVNIAKQLGLPPPPPPPPIKD